MMKKTVVIDEEKNQIRYYEKDPKSEDYLDSLNDPMRVNMGESKIAADIPESIPSWAEFQKKRTKS